MDKNEMGLVFNAINFMGYKPINIEYTDNYLTLDKGENNIIYFNIKGFHGWKFGMWIETIKSKLYFFCQHKDNIYKFKPYLSYFCAEYDLEELVIVGLSKWYKIKSILNSIKRHPFISYYMDAMEGGYVDENLIIYYIMSKYNIIINLLTNKFIK